MLIIGYCSILSLTQPYCTQGETRTLKPFRPRFLRPLCLPIPTLGHYAVEEGFEPLTMRLGIVNIILENNLMPPVNYALFLYHHP